MFNLWQEERWHLFPMSPFFMSVTQFLLLPFSSLPRLAHFARETRTTFRSNVDFVSHPLFLRVSSCESQSRQTRGSTFRRRNSWLFFRKEHSFLPFITLPEDPISVSISESFCLLFGDGKLFSKTQESSSKVGLRAQNVPLGHPNHHLLYFLYFPLFYFVQNSRIRGLGSIIDPGKRECNEWFRTNVIICESLSLTSDEE